MSINKIKTSALEIAEYHMSSNAAEKTKAKRCISQLTSQEREYFLEIIRHAQDPTLQFTSQAAINPSLISKLSRWNEDVIPKEKDSHLNRIEKSAMGVWRGIKNFIGFRKSSDKVLEELDKFALFNEVEETKERVDNVFFINDVTMEHLNRRKDILKNTENYSKEVFTLENEYKALGLKTGAPFDKVVKRYKELVKNSPATESIRIPFEAIYTFKKIEKYISQPLTLEKAFKLLDSDSSKTARQVVEAVCIAYIEAAITETDRTNLSSGIS